ncbi:MAG: hydratase [Mailhella sp.]|nr:hydratase [Mailhella sp.]
MVTVHTAPVILVGGTLLSCQEASARGMDIELAKSGTLAARILASHSKKDEHGILHVKFDAMLSHDITFVGIIQTARASGLKSFPVPYALTNCHNSLCAVGGTINEDDHLFGLTAARKFGGVYVPPHMAVIHQYAREMMAGCGRMILGSDSHTRYGALGTMGFGEGGPELVKQLLGRTYDIPSPEVVLVWLENSPRPGVGPQDVALALIAAVFKSGAVKNRVLEFAGPGLAGLSVDYRCGIDVMTTETTCLSSIWETDDKVKSYLEAHGRAEDFQLLTHDAPAAFSALVRIDLAKVEPMIALPFHPSNAYPIAEVVAHAEEYLGQVEEEAAKQYGSLANGFSLRGKIRSGGIYVDQGVIAGCAGGTFENLTVSAAILAGHAAGGGPFALNVYPASQPQALALVKNGSYARFMEAGAIVKTAFCGPCFGAGDTPSHGALSIRHSTRNFPNREGSKPGAGQLAGVALMDARSIAATAANGGRLTPATELDWSGIECSLDYAFDPLPYASRCYNGFGRPDPDAELKLGPNITDWPSMSPLPEHLLLSVASVILDPVTTTDELIPSGETSSLRSNPLKLSEFALSRKDPAYVGRAKAVQAMEIKRESAADDPAVAEYVRSACEALRDAAPEVWNEVTGQDGMGKTGIGSAIFAVKPGDGSAREQAASCQKVLGGWANLAVEYATKRYRSNLINWGMLPFLADADLGKTLQTGAFVLVPNVRTAIAECHTSMQAWVIQNGSAQKTELRLGGLTDEERRIILAGCLINFYNS